jgi:chorismate mutase/prephenate dehydratase
MVKKNITNKELNIIRDQIDTVDLAILKSLSKRAQLVIKAGSSKKNIGDNSFYKPEREAQIIKNLLSLNKSELKAQNIKAIYREIISACFSLEKEINIFYLGPKGTYSEIAVIDHFGSSTKKVSCSDINQIFESIKEENSFGVVPVENSSEGSVNQTLDCLQANDLSICGEMELPINHSLIGKKINLDKVDKVYGHEQAIAQCRNWLGTNLSKAKLISVESSGIALEKSKSTSNSLAIAHSSSSKDYKLSTLKSNIEDQKK